MSRAVKGEKKHVSRGAAVGVIAGALAIGVGVVAWRWMSPPPPAQSGQESLRRTLVDPGFARKPVSERREIIREIAAGAPAPEALPGSEGWDEEVEEGLREFLGDFTDEYAKEYVGLSDEEKARLIDEFLEDVELLIREMTGLPGPVAKGVVAHMTQGKKMASGQSGGVSDEDRATAEMYVRIMEWTAMSGDNMQQHGRKGIFLRDVARRGQR